MNTSEEGESKVEPAADGVSSEAKAEMHSQTENDNKESRYAKTFQVFKEMGLLEYALEMAKLSKENEQLQQKIDALEREVNKSSQKVNKGVTGKLDQGSQIADDTSTS